MTVTDSSNLLAVLIDPDRLASLVDTGLLDTDGDSVLDRLARVASAVTGAPRSYISLVTPDKEVFAGMVEHDHGDDPDRARSQPLTASFCQFAVATGEPLVIDDAMTNALVRDLPGSRDGSVGAYAGIPLRTNTGDVLGALCVKDAETHDWHPDQLQLLADLAVLAARELQLRIYLTREKRVRQLAAGLVRSVETANNTVLSLVVRAEQLDDPLLQRYAGLSRLRLEQLTDSAAEVTAALRDTTDNMPASQDRADLGQALQRAVRSTAAATGSTALRLQVPDHSLLVACDPIALEQSLTHLLISSLQHSHNNEPVIVTANVEADEVEVVVQSAGARVAAGELARVVGRVHRSSCRDHGEKPPSVTMLRGGGVVAESGSVKAMSGPEGLRFTARWPLVAAQ